MSFQGRNFWGLIIGGSSGFGLETAKRLSKAGMNVCVVHRDRRGAMDRIKPEFDRINASGAKLIAFNLDATSAEGIDTTLNGLSEVIEGGRVRVLLHSIAQGSLKPLVPMVDPVTKENLPVLDDEEISRTIHAMGVSLLSWTRAVFARSLFASDARVLSLTSEGNQTAWDNYAAVAAAKVTLEALSRAIAREFAPFGIRCNVLQPGVSETPALRLIPGSEKLIASALARNPFGRLTSLEDVANAVVMMASDEAAWINGSIIRVDGGEAISG